LRQERLLLQVILQPLGPIPLDAPVTIDTLFVRPIAFIWAIVNLTEVMDAFKKNHCTLTALVIISLYMVIVCKKFMAREKSKRHHSKQPEIQRYVSLNIMARIS
jgi:hypothetical protein